MKPNVMILHCHDLGKHISPYGVKTVQTPSMEKLGAEGVLFINSFCTSPGCSPSRAALFTGRYPHSTGVLGLTHDTFKWKMNEDEIHMAKFFKENGYFTAQIGVYHEHRVENSKPNEVNISYIKSLGYDKTTYEFESEKHYGEAVAENAKIFFTEQKDSDKPFFLSLGFFEPHRDFLCYDGIKPDKKKGVYIPDYIPQKTKEQKKSAEKEFSEIQGSIKKVDSLIGEVLDSLEENGLKGNTIVVFTSDHGIAMPRAKCSLYDPGIDVPLIISAPCLNLKNGERKDSLVSNVDVLPTLAEALGFNPPPRIEGKSFYSYMKGDSDKHREEIFAEKTYHKIYDPIRAIRTEKYKYIINFEKGEAYDCPSDIMKGEIYKTSIEEYSKKRNAFELYDLSKDKWEQNNLADNLEYKDIKADLHSRLVKHLRETEDPILVGPIRSYYYEDVLEETLK